MKSQIFNAPRIMIAATASGSGKTTLTCALLELLKKHGKNPVSFKCGPDYIDPMFHERVLGVHSNNLDSFFCSERQVQEIFVRNFFAGRDPFKPGVLQNPNSAPQDDLSENRVAVIEGVMGLFDGLAGKSLSASSYDIARISKTPVLLVIDSSGMSRSIVPLVKGFLDYDKANSTGDGGFIKGVFLNKASKSQFELLKPQIEAECGVKVLGYLPKNSQDVWKSRHLGLILPSEIENLRTQIKKTAEILEETLDFNALLEIMTKNTGLAGEKWDLKLGQFSQKNLIENFPLQEEFLHKNESSPEKNFQFSTSNFQLPIAVARDEAFCFYYHENLRVLEEMGAKIKFFSPLHDSCVPSDAAGILLGGGYPELYATQLQANESMRNSIKSAVKNGVSVLAECGGFMYLQEKMCGSGFAKSGEIIPFSEGGSDFSCEMCSVIEGECHYTGKLVRFGYAEFTPKNTSWAGNPALSGNPKGGLSIKGHEFHYFDSTNNGADFTARKPLSNRSWDCMIHIEKMLAGFPHLYYRSCPQIVSWFLDSCKKG